MSGSDGIFDYIDRQEVANELAKCIDTTGNSTGDQCRTLMEIVKELVMKSSKLWKNHQAGYRDDITFVVKRIDF